MTKTPPKGNAGMVVSLVATSITFLILSLRLITRAMIVRNVGSEDYVIIAAFVFSVALSALICVEFQHGQGYHIYTLSDGDVIIIFKALWASVPVYQMGLTLIKLSILVQYWRVFVGPWIRRMIITLLVVTTIYGCWSVLGTAFMCTPVSYFWDQKEKGTCMDRYAVWFANASINIVTDVIIFIMPMPVLRHLHLPQRQRLALMGIFGLGAFVCLTSVLRLKSLYSISWSTDITWDNGGAAMWSSLEVNVGIICASLPTLRTTISRFFPKLFSTSAAHSSHPVKTVQSTRRNSRRGSGFKRWPVQRETATWMQTLSEPEKSGASSPPIGIESQIGCGASAQSSIKGVEAAHIKVMTVTTQKVEEGVELTTVGTPARSSLSSLMSKESDLDGTAPLR